MIPIDIKFIATLRCSRRCDGCYQRPLIDSRPTYQASLDDVGLLLDVCQRSQYVIHSLMFTGGEPMLWDDLEKSVDLAANHPNVKKVFVVTNAHDPDRLNAIKDKLSGVFVTRYIENHDAVQKILNAYGARRCCIWDHEWFFKFPAEPLTGRKGNRVSCACPGILYYDGAVWSCSMIPSMILTYGMGIIRPDAMTILSEGFIERLTARQPACSACVSNRRIKKYLDFCRSCDLNHTSL